MSDDNKSSSNINPEKWNNSDVISKIVISLSVFKVHQCLRNNSFAAELLKTKDSFFRAVINKDDVDIPQNNNMNIPLKINNQSSVPDNVSTKIVATPIFNSVTVNDHVSTSNNDVSIPTKINVNIPKK